jgi:hypothetical protein
MTSNSDDITSSTLPKCIQYLLIAGAIWFFAYFLVKLIELFFGTKKRPRTPRVFISHSWRYDNDYWTLIKRFSYLGFQFYNHSVPANKPVDDATSKRIGNAIRAKISGCSRVLVLGGHYANSYWIKKEIQIAKVLKKEIIAIRPRNQYSMPKYLQLNADKILSFNARNIIKQIKH